MERDLAVCSGMRTRTRNCLCSDFKGSAKPFMMLPETRTSKFRDVFYICAKETNSCTQRKHTGESRFSGGIVRRHFLGEKWCFSTQMLNITHSLSPRWMRAQLRHQRRPGCSTSEHRPGRTERTGTVRPTESGAAEVWETICLRLLFVFPRLASVRPRPTGCRCMWAEL